MTTTDSRNGIRVPSWAVVAFCAAVAIAKIGWDARGKLSQIEENQRDQARLAKDMGVRLCRIEAAVHVAQWPTCMTNDQTQAMAIGVTR